MIRAARRTPLLEGVTEASVAGVAGEHDSLCARGTGDRAAEVIALKGDSYRLKDRDLGRVPTAATDDR